jgi:hypothetical protein
MVSDGDRLGVGVADADAPVDSDAVGDCVGVVEGVPVFVGVIELDVLKDREGVGETDRVGVTDGVSVVVCAPDWRSARASSTQTSAQGCRVARCGEEDIFKSHETSKKERRSGNRLESG